MTPTVRGGSLRVTTLDDTWEKEVFAFLEWERPQRNPRFDLTIESLTGVDAGGREWSLKGVKLWEFRGGFHVLSPEWE